MSEDLAASPRPNPARAVRLVGPLNKKAAARLSREITQLRLQSDEPVTVPIRSTGGEVTAFHQLDRIFHPRDKTKKRGQIITVADKAGSAATWLLILGHHAFAAKNARISIHGARCAVTPLLKSLRRETALALALHLDQANRSIAQALARRIALRLGARHRELKNSASRPSRRQQDSPSVIFEKFIRQLVARQSSARTKHLLHVAGERLNFIFAHASLFPGAKLRTNVPPLAVQESKLYQALIAHEVQSRPTPDWRLRSDTTVKLWMDYLLAREFLPGHHLQFARRLARAYGRDFMTPKETAHYDRQHFRNKSAAESFLFKNTLSYTLGLWYLSVALGLGLLAGEFVLTAKEARWLGLVDEVLERT